MLGKDSHLKDFLYARLSFHIHGSQDSGLVNGGLKLAASHNVPQGFGGAQALNSRHLPSILAPAVKPPHIPNPGWSSPTNLCLQDSAFVAVLFPASRSIRQGSRSIFQGFSESDSAERHTSSMAILPGTKRFVTPKTALRPVVVLMMAGKRARLAMLKSIGPAATLIRNFTMRCHTGGVAGCSW